MEINNAIQILQEFSGIDPQKSGGFVEMLSFYRNTPKCSREKMEELGEAISLVLDLPVPDIHLGELMGMRICDVQIVEDQEFGAN